MLLRIFNMVVAHEANVISRLYSYRVIERLGTNFFMILDYLLTELKNEESFAVVLRLTLHTHTHTI